MVSTLQMQHDMIDTHPLKLGTLKQPETYSKNECAWFFKKEHPNWLLSNMAGKMPIIFDKRKWNSSEQLYQASKYSSEIVCLPKVSKTQEGRIPNVRKRIEMQKAARGAKMTQKCAVKAGLVRSDWDDPTYEVRIYSMLWVLELKLRHNRITFTDTPSFGEVLRATGDKPIVEISNKDDFWGCKETAAGILQGQNVLGKLLTIVRDRYDDIKAGNLLYPEGFLLP